jgi:regulator of replication initiation timing
MSEQMSHYSKQMDQLIKTTECTNVAVNKLSVEQAVLAERLSSTAVDVKTNTAKIEKMANSTKTWDTISGLWMAGLTLLGGFLGITK